MPVPMRDVIVLVPGILGSVLRKHDKVVWGYSARSIGSALFTLGAGLRAGLALPDDDRSRDDLEDGITADALMPDLHLIPGFWKVDGYTKIVSALTSEFDVVQGQNFFTFPYDWRRDNRVAARKLATATEGWLRAWKQRSGHDDAPLILIAHSMGCLVSRYFLECMEGWKATRALINFGTPFRGSLNALDALANGASIGPFKLTEVVRELTAVYQLLPTYECYDTGDGIPIHLAEVKAIPGLDGPGAMARVAAALAFHKEIADAVTSNQKDPNYQKAGYVVYPVVGVAQDTKLSARVAGQRLELLTTHKGQALGGDGTVPRMSAIPPEATTAVGAMYAGTTHGSLQNADAVVQHLSGVLSGFNFDLGDFLKPKVNVALDVDDLYAAEQPIVIRARPGAEDVPLTATLRSGADDQELMDVEMKPAGDRWLTAEFPPQTEGAFRVVVSGTDRVQPAEDAFVVGAAMPQQG
jgi:hypothetical protein